MEFIWFRKEMKWVLRRDMMGRIWRSQAASDSRIRTGGERVRTMEDQICDFVRKGG